MRQRSSERGEVVLEARVADRGRVHAPRPRRPRGRRGRRRRRASRSGGRRGSRSRRRAGRRVPSIAKPSSVASISAAERRSAPRPRSRSGPTPCGAAPRRRGSPSRPRRSRRRARPAAARRSPAAPRRRRPRSPRSARGADATARPARLAARARLSGSTSISAPIRSRIASRPVRVGLRPTPGRARPRCRRRAAPRRRRRRPRRSRRARRSRPASSALGRSTATAPPSRSTRRPAAASIRSVWSRLGSGSTTVVSPSASRPAKQQARLDLGAGDRQLVVDPVQRRALDRERRQPVRRGSSSRAPIRRSGSAIRSTGRRRIESSPSSVQVPAGLPGEPARQEPQQGAGVADVDRGRGRAPAQADARDRAAPDGDPAPVARRSTVGAERLDRGQGRARVGGVEVALDRALALGHRGDQRRPVRDRLVGRRAQVAAQRARRDRSGSSSRLALGEHGHGVAELADQRRRRAPPARRRRPRARSRPSVMSAAG